jgi:hypothetical protein
MPRHNFHPNATYIKINENTNESNMSIRSSLLVALSSPCSSTFPSSMPALTLAPHLSQKLSDGSRSFPHIAQRTWILQKLQKMSVAFNLRPQFLQIIAGSKLDRLGALYDPGGSG